MNAEFDAGAAEPTVPQALGRLRVVLEDAFTRSSRELGLTAQQAELLCAALSPAAVGDLAATLRCDRSNVSRLVDRASTHGLLRRQGAADDGRVTMIELTPRGRRLAERFIVALEARTNALLAGWSEARRRQAAGLLSELADVLDEPSATPQARSRGRARSRPVHEDADGG